MKYDLIEDILYTAADMQRLAEPCDALSKLVLQFKPAKELDFDELELVSAAGYPSYQDFIQWLRESNQI